MLIYSKKQLFIVKKVNDKINKQGLLKNCCFNFSATLSENQPITIRTSLKQECWPFKVKKKINFATQCHLVVFFINITTLLFLNKFRNR